MAKYSVIALDMNQVLASPTAIDAQPGQTSSGFVGSPVDYITILSVPAGATFNLHIGQGGQPIPITGPIGFLICPEEVGGIYVTIPAAVAGFAEIVLSFSEGSVAGVQ